MEAAFATLAFKDTNVSKLWDQNYVKVTFEFYILTKISDKEVMSSVRVQ